MYQNEQKLPARSFLSNCVRSPMGVGPGHHYDCDDDDDNDDDDDDDGDDEDEDGDDGDCDKAWRSLCFTFE